MELIITTIDAPDVAKRACAVYLAELVLELADAQRAAGTNGRQTSMQIASWVVALHMAEQLVEQNRTKDWARMLQDGFAGIEILTSAGLEEHIQAEWLEWAGDSEEVYEAADTAEEWIRSTYA